MTNELIQAAEALTKTDGVMGELGKRYLAIAELVTPEVREPAKRMVEYERAADAGEGLLEWDDQADDMMDLVRFALSVLAVMEGE